MPPFGYFMHDFVCEYRRGAFLACMQMPSEAATRSVFFFPAPLSIRLFYIMLSILASGGFEADAEANELRIIFKI